MVRERDTFLRWGAGRSSAGRRIRPAMTPYTAFEPTPPRGTPPADDGAAESQAILDAARLDGDAFALLTALFEADGATPDALGARVRAPREAVDGLLGTLGRLGYVERDGDAAWLTGEAFGLRRAVRRAGDHVPIPPRSH